MYRTVNDLSEVREYLSGQPLVAFDIETAPLEEYRYVEKAALDAHKAHVVGISFSVAENSGIYVPLTHRKGKNADAAKTWSLLDSFAADPTVIKIAHNMAFESMFFYAQGIVIQPPVYDTIAAAQLTLKSNTAFRSLSDSGLKTLVPKLIGDALPTFEQVTGGRHFDQLDPADAKTVRYACADSDYTLRLYHIFNAWFDRYLPKHRQIVERIESPTAVYCGLMKYNGLPVNRDLMLAKQEEAETALDALREKIAFMIGDVDIGANASTAAFKRYLYKDLGLPVFRTTEKNQPAVDDEALILLHEHCVAERSELAPLIDLIRDYRKWGKLKSTYVDGYLEYINPATGRIHPDLMPLATETGRFAARNPNMQNMPRAGGDKLGVRNFITAPEGKVLLSLDFSQIELRVGAFYCRDKKMLETYRIGGDIHNQTADVVFGVKKHDKEERTIAKNVNFGTFFGLYPNGLQRTLKFKAGLDVPLTQCEKIISNIKTGYPALVRWQEDTKRHAAGRRYSETWLGRRRYLPGISSKDWSQRSFAERCALNTPIQGTAADILKLALARIIDGLPERPWLRPLLQIHDELVFELPEERVEEATAFIRECMEAQPFPEFDLPIIAEAAVGTSFGVL